MKLIACHVENFGKLSNLNMNFSDGINIINQPNGWGKSTLAAFLKAMLYGFDSKKEQGAFDKERKIYKPWQGGTYGGELDFEIDGKAYRISRTFGSTEKTDEFHLYDLNTNLECDDYSENLGEEIFDIDRNSFKRSIYIAQNDCMFESSDSINAKLGNLAENTNDINNFENAQKVLKDMLNRMSPDRITGSIKKRKNAITALAQELKSFEAASIAAQELTEKLDEKKAQKQELFSIRQEYGKALQVASEDSRRRELNKTYQVLCEDASEKEKACKEFLKMFPESVPDEEDIAEQLEKARKLEMVKASMENFRLTDEEVEDLYKYDKMFEEQIPADEAINAMIQKSENIAKVKNEHSQLALKLSQMESLAIMKGNDEEEEEEIGRSGFKPAGIVLLVMGVLAAVSTFGYSLWDKDADFIFYIIGGIGAGFALLGLLFIFIGHKRNKNNELVRIRRIAEQEQSQKEKEQPIQELREQLSQIEDGIALLVKDVKAFLNRFGIDAEDTEYQQKLFEIKNCVHDFTKLRDQKQKFDSAKNDYDRMKAELLEYGKKAGITFGNDIVSELNKVQSKAVEYRLTQRNYEAAALKKQQFEETHDMDDILAEKECPYSLNELNRLIHEVDERAEDVRDAIEQYTRQLDMLQEQLDIKDEKEKELEEYNFLQEKETEKYDILKTTQQFLASAKERFTAHYMAPVSKGFRKYYELLTDDVSGNWMVDANISVKIKEVGEMRETKWLSAGYQDLIGVCMRLALVDAMYPDEKPFLILDDPFVNLDDDKLAHGKHLLIALEKDYQAIYFTCHESREYK